MHQLFFERFTAVVVFDDKTKPGENPYGEKPNRKQALQVLTPVEKKPNTILSYYLEKC